MGSWTTKAAAAAKPTKPTKSRATRQQKPTATKAAPEGLEIEGNPPASPILKRAMLEEMPNVTLLEKKITSLTKDVTTLTLDLGRLKKLLEPSNATFLPEELDVLEKAMSYLAHVNWLNATPKLNANRPDQGRDTRERYERMRAITNKIRQLVKK